MSKKPFRRFKVSENSLEGELLLEGPKIRVLFRFSPERVAFVKSIKGSRYDPETKTWTFPREKLDDFNKSKLFPEDLFPRKFSESDVLESLEQLATLKEQAILAYKNNPFSVEKQFLRLLQLDVIFSLANDLPQLSASVRFGSKATAILTRLKGSHFIRSDGHFVVPVEALAPLLSKLRDKKLSFAVESSSAEHLKKTAELRKSLLIQPGSASPQDLELACLTPYIDFADTDGELAFAVKFATSRHLAELFPDENNFHSRKKKSQTMGEKELLTLISRITNLKYPLYIARAVNAHISRLGLHYEEELSSGNLSLSEELLPFLKAACAWVVLSETKAGLLIDESYSNNEKLKNREYESIQQKRFYSEKESKLLFFYNELKGEIEAKESDAFSALISDLAKRNADITNNQRAKQSSDAEFESSLFSDETLPKKLFPHQRVAVKWLANREYSLLGDDMGLGKTLSVIATIDLLLNSSQISFALIVCPNSLTRNWQREVDRFIPKRRFYILPESPKERGRLYRTILSGDLECDALVINYERMRRPDVHEFLQNLLQNRSTLLCCDESQRIKNPRSQTFLALNQLAPLCLRRINLTGTPTPRDVSDIWSQVLLLDGGKRFGKHYTKWLKSIAELGTKYSDFAVRKFKPDAVEETISRVHELLLRRRKEDVISLPEKTFIYRDCKLIGSQATRYKEVCEQLLLRMNNLKGESYVKQIDNLLEEYLRAVQIASNPRLVDESWQGDPAKFTELDEIVDEIVKERGEKIVIWTNFLKNIDELLIRYKEFGARAFSGKVTPAQRDQTIQEFQNGSDVKILIAIPAAGGVGITLTAAQTAIYLDKSWNAEHWLQSVDRIHRIGQRGTVNIISLSASKVDELISRNLTRKEKAQTNLLGDNLEDREYLMQAYPTREELFEALV